MHAPAASAIASSDMLPASKPTPHPPPGIRADRASLGRIPALWSDKCAGDVDERGGPESGLLAESLSGKPEVTAAAFVIGSYTWFIMGCSVAGVAAHFQEDKAFRLPVAESLAAYYLAVPVNKNRLDMQFARADTFLQSKEPALQRAVVDTRSVLLRNDAGITNDDKLMTLLRNLMYQEKPLSVEEAIEGFGTSFNFGLWLDPGEVERLWGIQISTTVVPLMDQTLGEAQDEMLTDVSQFIPAQGDKAGAELPKHGEESEEVMDLTEALRASVEEVRARQQAAYSRRCQLAYLIGVRQRRGILASKIWRRSASTTVPQTARWTQSAADSALEL